MDHISLTALSDELREAAEASATGIAIRPLKTDGALQQVAVRFRAGGVLPDHDNPGEAMALLLEGSVRFHIIDGDGTHEMRAGDLMAVPDARHRVEALEESLLVLSFVRP